MLGLAGSPDFSYTKSGEMSEMVTINSSMIEVIDDVNRKDISKQGAPLRFFKVWMFLHFLAFLNI
jgi:hypothetical protein